MAEDAGTPAASGQLTAGQPQAGADSRRPGCQDEMTEGERRLLTTMPLHAITALHGEAGLRERFAIEIASLPDGDELRAERALEWRRGCMRAIGASASHTSITYCGSLSASSLTTACGTPM